MKTLDEIKKLMAKGETAQADEALKELLAAEPDNLQAKMLYGTCRQLLGDEETFKRIHDELVPKIASLEKNEPNTETVSLWRKYHRLWEWLIVAGLILAGAATAVWFFGRDVNNKRAPEAERGEIQRSKYMGPPRHELRHQRHNCGISTTDESRADL